MSLHVLGFLHFRIIIIIKFYELNKIPIFLHVTVMDTSQVATVLIHLSSVNLRSIKNLFLDLNNKSSYLPED